MMLARPASLRRLRMRVGVLANGVAMLARSMPVTRYVVVGPNGDSTPTIGPKSVPAISPTANWPAHVWDKAFIRNDGPSAFSTARAGSTPPASPPTVSVVATVAVLP